MLNNNTIPVLAAFDGRTIQSRAFIEYMDDDEYIDDEIDDKLYVQLRKLEVRHG